MNGKKALQVAALWLCLLALAAIFTDRGAYTWQAAGGFVQTLEAAEEAEQEAQDAWQAERDAAASRTALGLWGLESGEALSQWPMVRSAQEDGQPGLNLMWGAYEVAVDYRAQADAPVRVVSAGYQAFIEDGEAVLPAGEGRALLRFTLTDATPQVRLACGAEAEIAAVTVRKIGPVLISPDAAAYAALLGAVLTVLLVLSWDTRPQAAARRRDALALVFIAGFASMPLLWTGLYDGHDLFFHLNRIEGIASGLRSGQFPVRIHASTLQGYGFASSVFYPELFLYIPALMRNLGVSLMNCVRLFEMGINLVTALVCYMSVHRLMRSRRAALGASALYMLSIYRVVNLYVRATMGESLAMIFFPLMVLALYEVLLRDEARWPLLALAMTGVAMSHLLSTLFCAAFCALAALVCLPRLVRAPRRIGAILKAAGVTVLCVLGFIVPMLEYSAAGVNTSVVRATYENTLTLGSYLVGFSGAPGETSAALEDYAYTVGVVPGLAMLAGCALLLVQLYAERTREAETARRDRLTIALLALGGLALLGATDAFPWEAVCAMRRPISTFFMQIQFPWRLVSIAVPLLSIAGAWGYLRAPKHAGAGMAVLLALSVVFSGYTMRCYVQSPVFLRETDFCDTRVHQYEYIYPYTERDALAPGYIAVGGAPDAVVTDYAKRGTSLSFTVQGAQDAAYIETPLLYYPGYEAEVNGEAAAVARGTNNVLRILCAGIGSEATVSVRYAEPLHWRALELLGVLGALLLAASCRRMRLRAAALDDIND